MKIVKFPMYFECVGYQTIVLPDYVDADDKDAVWDYIEDRWDNIPVPDDYEYVCDSCQPDRESTYEIKED